MTAAAYAAGYSEGIALTVTEGKAPQVGQLLAFGATPSTRHTYTVIESEAVSTTSTRLHLDRPLEVAVGSGDDAFRGPYGAMNLAFHRDALALVTRPLALPKEVDGRDGRRGGVQRHRHACDDASAVSGLTIA